MEDVAGGIPIVTLCIRNEDRKQYCANEHETPTIRRETSAC